MLWHSNAPITLTGYGMQTALFAPRVAALGYDVSLNCPMSILTSPITWNGMVMYGSAGDPLGNDVLPMRSGMFDMTITLCDLYGLMPCSGMLAGRKIAHWMPIDTHPMGEHDIAALRATGGMPIAVSRYGYEQIRREGFDPVYVPHGIDLGVFKPDPEAGAEFRKANGISPDTFVIGLHGVNKPDSRKGLDQQMQAFRIFHQRHPDSLLFMRTTHIGGWNLEKVAVNLGIRKAVKFPELYTIISQLTPPEGVAQWCNSLDILTACSEAEGFGLPILEAQACGIPVVTNNFASMTELCSSGWLTENQKHWVGNHEAWWATPDVESIAARYEEAWEARDDASYRAKALAFAQDYDADLVTEKYWKPALAEMEKRYA